MVRDLKRKHDETQNIRTTPALGGQESKDLERYQRSALNKKDYAQWKRPAVDYGKLTKQKYLECQVVDVQSDFVKPSEATIPRQLIQAEGDAQVPVMRVYGVTPEGHSANINCWNFYPYFFVEPKQVIQPERVNDNYVKRGAEDLRTLLDAFVKAKRRERWNDYNEQQQREKNQGTESEAKRPRIDPKTNSSTLHAFFGKVGTQNATTRNNTENRDVRRANTQSYDGNHATWANSGLDNEDNEGGDAEADESDFSERTSWRNPGPQVIHVEPVVRESVETRDKKKKVYMKVTLRTPSTIYMLRSAIEKRQVAQNIIKNITFESGVRFEMRFMVDKLIGGAGWMRVPTSDCDLVDENDKKRRSSRTQIEVNCNEDAVEGLDMFDKKNQRLYAAPSKMRAVSYDIEAVPDVAGTFPKPESAVAIQIAAVSYEAGDNEGTPLSKVLFCVGTCDPIPGVRVVQCRDERSMLRQWGQYLAAHDPDICYGWNNVNFDVLFLTRRAQILGVEDYLMSSRCLHKEAVCRRDKRVSRNNGNVDSYQVSFWGRVEYDLMKFFQQSKLRSYKLDSVGKQFLGEQKHEMDYREIPKLQNGTRRDRTRLGRYTVQDVVLPKRLALKKKPFGQLFEIARVNYVRMGDIQGGGATMKTFARVLAQTRALGFIIPHKSANKRIYKGATVLRSMGGYYKTPVSVLDFASLYPSIMMAFNMGPDTYITAQEAKKYNEEDYYTCPLGNRYLRKHIRTSILCQTLDDILTCRGNAKKQMAEAAKQGDKEEEGIYNSRQLALKIVANSVYGFTGLPNNGTYWYYVSESTTAIGRQMLETIKEAVEKHFSRANGYEADARVIYGDTDSIMIYWDLPVDKQKALSVPDPDRPGKFLFTDYAKKLVQRAINLSEEAAKLCNKLLVKPNKLEFENVYLPYLLCVDIKKHYAGPFWENATNYSYRKDRGIECVRRNNPLMVMETQSRALDDILFGMDPEAAVRRTKRAIADMRDGSMDLSKYVLSQTLQRRAEDYKSKQPHAEIDRKKGNTFDIGDRIPYIIVDKGKSKLESRVAMRAETPLDVLKYNMRPDVEFYTKRIISSMDRIFTTIYGKTEGPKKVREGLESATYREHLHIHTEEEDCRRGTLLGTFKARPKCMKCRISIDCDTSLPSSEQPRLCPSCVEKGVDDLMNKCQRALEDLETETKNLWDTCRTCQGVDIDNTTDPLNCTAIDCDIFFKRTKKLRERNVMRNDVTALAKQLEAW